MPNVTKTIARIKEFDGKPWRTFQYTKGPQAGTTGASVDVEFDDGDEGQYATKPDFAQKHVDALTALLGKPSSFELEPKPDYNGIPQWKLKSYPGKPTGGGDGGGGGGKGGGDWETATERAWRDASITAQVAAKLVAEAAARENLDVKLTVASLQEFTVDAALAIRQAALTVFGAGDYPGAAPAPGPNPDPTTPPQPQQQQAPAAPPKPTAPTQPAEVVDTSSAEWQEAYDRAVERHGSPVRLQIAMKKNPEEMTVAELTAAAIADA